nr:permease [uncultured Desulfobulbus sp.]
MNRQPAKTIPLYQPQETANETGLRMELAWVAGLLFLTVAFLVLLLGQTPPYASLVGNISINFIAMMVEALPFMLIGSLVGGVIEVFVPTSLVETIFQRRRFRAIFLAAAMGIIFPVCECAIVPVIRRLLGKGVPFGAAVAFLLGGPIVNPLVAASTAVAYNMDWMMVVLRLGCGYAIATTVGLLLSLRFKNDNALVGRLSPRYATCCGHDHCDENSHATGLGSKIFHALGHAADDFFSVGYYLVIGTFIAAFVRSVVPLEIFNHFFSSPWQAILVMMVMAILLNLCSEADAFIAASFRELLPGSAQLAFMVLGPMLDIKLFLMYFGLFTKKVIAVLIASVLVAVFLTTLALHLFFPQPF